MASTENPPPLIDGNQANESTKTKKISVDLDEPGEDLYEGDPWEDDEYDMDECEGEDEEECEESDEEECEDEDECEEGDEEIEDDSDIDDGAEDLQRNRFPHHPSEQGFKESDLEERKTRRYLIGTHSFLDLADPHLEDALEPVDLSLADENLTQEERNKRSVKEEKKLYKDTCAELGVRPDPKVMISLREITMDLTGMGMNAKEIIAVCKILQKNTHVEFLSLAGNSAGKEGGLAIAELISNNENIISYNLENTEILEVFDVICEAASQSLCIMHLNFSKNELEDIDMPYIKKILREAFLIKTIKLNANFIKDDGLRHIGQGLKDNQTLELIDLSHNKIFGDKKAAIFFTACAEHPNLRVINLRRNFMQDEGGKGIARALGGNPRIEELDLSFNLMDEGAAQAFGRSLARQKKRDLRLLKLELQKWRQESAELIIKPLARRNIEMPIELIDFGMMLDIHTAFIDTMEKVLKVRPDLKILHGQRFGLDHAKGPDHRALVIRKADSVCKSFETPLVMLMEELAKEKNLLTVAEFRKFIKQCNLYKDKTLTEAFEKVFEKVGTGSVDAEAILEAFDKEYPGLRKIPEPVEEEEEVPKPEKKKKGKGGKGKGKGSKGAKGGKGGKGKGKKK